MVRSNNSTNPFRARPTARPLAMVLGLVLALTAGLSGMLPAQAAQTVAAEAVASENRVWVVDAVDDAVGNRWLSVDTGTTAVTIQTGDTVEWQFDLAQMSHDLTSRTDVGSTWPTPLAEFRGPNGDPIRQTFNTPGTYHYECTIHGTTMRGTVIVEGTAVNQPPTATPDVDPTSGTAPLATHFMANATDPDGDPLTYLWDFGESDLPGDTSTSAHASHNYVTPGSYTANLTVSDNKGGIYQESFTIDVAGGANPVVTATGNPTTGTAPLTVQFQGGATDQQGGTLAYAWDFGVPGTNADTSASTTASWTYTAAGTYSAVLTATDPQSNTGSATVQIVVGGAPVVPELGVEVTATPTSGTSPLGVQFSTSVTEASTTAGLVKPFSDGLVTYPNITGTAEMMRGDDHTMTSLSVSGLKPNAAHMVHVHEQSCGTANAGAHFRFDTTKPFSEANEIWLPFTSDAQGNGNPPMEHSSLRAGPQAVAIVIHDPDNPAKRIGCVDLAPSGLGYAWDFGDGTSGTGPNPLHTYTKAGTFNAEVTVTDGAEQATDSVQIALQRQGTTTVATASGSMTVGALGSVGVRVDGTTHGTPTGTVEVRSGGTRIGIATLVGGGASVALTGPLAAGARTLTVLYSGDAAFTGSQDALAVSVAKATSATTATLSTGQVRYGNSATLTVKVKSPTTTPTGSVTIKSGTTTIATGTLTNGSLTVKLRNTLTVKVHPLTISYAGTTNVKPSSAKTTLTVVKAISKITAVTPPLTLNKATKKVVPIKVVTNPTAAVAAGKVSVSVTQWGVVKASTSGTVAAGKGTFTLPVLKIAGNYRVKMSYLGSATVAASKSEFVVTVK